MVIVWKTTMGRQLWQKVPIRLAGDVWDPLLLRSPVDACVREGRVFQGGEGDVMNKKSQHSEWQWVRNHTQAEPLLRKHSA